MNEVWKIDTFNSGENDGYVVVIINSFTLIWPVHNHGPNRRRGCPGGVSDQKEKTHF